MRRWRQLVLGIAIGVLASGQAEPPASPVKVKSEALCRVLGDRTPHFRLVTNPDMSQVAAIDTWEEGKWYVSVNSVVWEFYTDVDAPSAQFSSDGNHLLLLAKHDNAWFLIRDNADARPLGQAACCNLALSRDGQHDACLQASPNGWHVLADGKPVTIEGWNDFAQVSGPLMTPEGQVAFVGRMGKKAVMILDGKVLGTLDADVMTAPALAPDGKQLVCGAYLNDDNGHAVTRIVNGSEANRWPIHKEVSVNNLTISPDGQRVAWAEADDGGQRIVIDGVSRESRIGPIDQLIFSPDSKHFAWAGSQGPVANRRYAEVDGKPFMLDLGLKTEPVAFSADSRNLHCVGRTVRFDCCLESEGWLGRFAMASADGQLHISLDDKWISAQDARGNSVVFESTRPLDCSLADSNTAYILTETPRGVQANGQKINVVTRYEFKWTEKAAK